MNRFTKTAVAAGGIATGAFGLCSLCYEMLFNRYFVLPDKIAFSVINCDSDSLASSVKENVKWVENYGYEKHKIVNGLGMSLTGRLLKAEKESDVYVLGVHGYRGNGKRLGGMARYYIGKGYNVFLPDHIASGESEGKYCALGFWETADCLKWLSYMTENFGKDIKIVLHGVSMGAAVVMLMAGDEKLPANVKFAVEDSGFTDITELLRRKLREHKIKSDMPISILNFNNKRKLGFDLKNISPVKSVRRARVPMLFIHGKRDGLIPSDMALELYNACSSEKKLLMVDGANHAQNLKVGGEKYFSAIDSFIEKYL